MIIAVDGPAGSGKSTIAAAVARKLAASHVDTGAMYRRWRSRCCGPGSPPRTKRGVASLLPATEISAGDGSVVCDGEEVSGLIRTPAVTAASSVVAQHRPVREWMVDRQRRVIHGAPAGAVVEGRDIGTVVLPDAELKIFLTASEQLRARRRALQHGATEAEAQREVSSRDARDTARSHSPLRAADDAVVIDTTDLSIDEVVDEVLRAMRERQEA